MSRGVNVNFKVEGLSTLRDRLKALEPITGLKVLASAGKASFKPVAEEAKELVAVRTGDLRDSIRVAAVKPRRGNVVCSVGVKIGSRKVKDEVAVYGSEGELLDFEETSRRVNAGWRWHFIEFGTAHHPAQPFLRPAFSRRSSEALGKLTVNLKKKIDQTVRRRNAK